MSGPRRPSLRDYILPGALGGFVPGLLLGGLAGAGLAWGSGAALSWMRQLSFPTGIQIHLMPCGNRTEVLENLRDGWYWVVVVAGLALGLLGVLMGSLTGLLVWAARSALETPVESEP